MCAAAHLLETPIPESLEVSPATVNACQRVSLIAGLASQYVGVYNRALMRLVAGIMPSWLSAIRSATGSIRAISVAVMADFSRPAGGMRRAGNSGMAARYRVSW